MKRSEMVNIIWDAINELEDGDYILQRIEAAGMLPPAREGIHTTFMNGQGTTSLVTIHAWEPEDSAPTHDDHLTYKEWRNRYGG